MSGTGRIIGLMIGGFLLIIVFSWFDELYMHPFFENQPPWIKNYWEVVFETLSVLLVAVPVLIFTRRMLNRLYYLEGFFRVCSWCKRVEDADRWIPFETYVRKNLNADTSHGICHDCLADAKAEMSKTNPTPTPIESET